MTHTELRIGNKVLYKGKVIDIIPNDISLLFELFRAGRTSENYEPIPLTPDILEKSGFVLTDRIGVGFKKYTNDTDSECIRLRLIEVGNNKPFTVEYCYNDNVYLKRKVYYLHDLQNLYFALTGDELEIKP